MQQVGIRGSDVERMLAVTRHYADDGGEPLPWELMADLKDLVPCDMLEASGQDTPRWEFFAEQQWPNQGCESPASADDRAIYQMHYWSSCCSHFDRVEDRSAFRISDLVSRRDYHRSAMYVDLMRPGGCEHELAVGLDAGGHQRTLRLLFNRGPGLDFSPRDVAVLTLLRPHLQAAYSASERRRSGVPLTARQRQILNRVRAGDTNRQIARTLGLSEATVRTHMQNIFERLQVSNRTAAVTKLDAPAGRQATRGEPPEPGAPADATENLHEHSQ